MKNKHLQELIHLLMRLVEPQLSPNTSPASVQFYETDQFCLKPNFNYIFNTSFCRFVNQRGSFINGINFNRITEDIYFEVKLIKETLNLEEIAQTQNRAF